MRILVTGGAGFIGSHLVDALRQRACDVAVLDDLSRGRAHLLPPGIPLHRVDVRDSVAVDRVFAVRRPTHVLHLAAQVSVARSVLNPSDDVGINVLGGLSVLRAATAHGTGHFLFASSGGAVYGDVPAGQRAAESWPLKPKSPYGTSKAAFEMQLATSAALTGMKCASLRLANVYGPRQRPDEEAGVIAVFAERLLRGEPVTVVGRLAEGDEGCVRDYVYVLDVVDAFLLALDRELRGVYNVATGLGRTTRSLLDAVAKEAAVTPRIRTAPPRPGELESSVLDATALTALGWRASVSFEEGVKRTVEGFRAMRHAAGASA